MNFESLADPINSLFPTNKDAKMKKEKTQQTLGSLETPRRSLA
jgi:hypothetical protein